MLKLSYQILPLIFFVAALSACGNIGSDHSSRFASSSSKKSTVSVDTQAILSTTETVGEFTCPKTPNTAPDYDYDLDGSKFYRICKHKTLVSDILLWGKSGAEKQICIFPVEYVDRDHMYAKPDTSTGQPLVSCVDNNEAAGQVLRFPSITYNALFVVEGSDKLQMQSCLKQMNFFLCPHYTYGKFR